MVSQTKLALRLTLDDFGDRCKTYNLQSGRNTTYNCYTSILESCPSDPHVYTSSPIFGSIVHHFQLIYYLNLKGQNMYSKVKKKIICSTPDNLQYLAGSDGNRKKLSSGFELLFFEQFTAEHHVFVLDFFFNDGSKYSELAIYLFCKDRRSNFSLVYNSRKAVLTRDKQTEVYRACPGLNINR